MMLAEWETSGRVLIALPHEDTDWRPILEEAQAQTMRLVDAIAGEGKRVVLLVPSAKCRVPGTDGPTISADGRVPSAEDRTAEGLVRFLEMDYNDTWTRDYGPISVTEEGERKFLDFGFNGWGLKFAADKDNLVNRQLFTMGEFPEGRYRNESAFILEGGSVESDGKGTILTTSRCLCSPNRNGGLTKEEAEKELKRRLGATHVLFLDYGALEGDDTDSHIDTLARLAPGDTILFTGCRDEEDSQFEELKKMREQLATFRTPEGKPYNLVELPLPDAIYDEEGQRLPATYANYLVTEDVIFMPTYNQGAKDELAKMTVKIAFPQHRVVGVDCTTLIKQHGSLHCATSVI